MKQEHDNFEPPLSRGVIAKLDHASSPPAELEERVVAGLQQRGVLRRATSWRAAPWLVGAIAAGIAFAAGLSIGRRSATPAAVPTKMIDVADSAIVRAPLVNEVSTQPSRLVTWF